MQFPSVRGKDRGGRGPSRPVHPKAGPTSDQAQVEVDRLCMLEDMQRGRIEDRVHALRAL